MLGQFCSFLKVFKVLIGFSKIWSQGRNRIQEIHPFKTTIFSETELLLFGFLITKTFSLQKTRN